jgi:hypothetical protein
MALPFSWFPSVLKQMLTRFQNSNLLLRASHFDLHQNYTPSLSKQAKYFSQLYNWTLIQKIENSRSLSQAAISNHQTVFTFTLPLSVGRAGEN